MPEQPIHIAAEHGDLAQVRAEVQAGANVEAKNNVGETPLIYATMYGRLEVVKYLVNEAGANVEAKDSGGGTPLINASAGGHLEVVKYLVNEAGANVEVKDNDGNTALDWARRYNETTVVQYLEQYKRGFLSQWFGSKSKKKSKSSQFQLDSQKQKELLSQQQAKLEQQRQELDLEQQRQELEKRRLELERQRQELERQRHQQEEVALICPVFLSHTGADQDAATFAAVLESKLEDKYEVKAFLDSETLKVGDRWRQKIEVNAKGCKVFVAILSPNYFLRFWCLHELDLALRHNCRIVPVVYDASLEAPKPTDAAFVRKLRKILSGKDLEEDPDFVLNRWLANIKTLDGIQACFNRAAHKHWMKQFCNEVAEKVNGVKLQKKSMAFSKALLHMLVEAMTVRGQPFN